jgi:hypothetical protein
VKIGDFGIAKRVLQTDSTALRTEIGTPSFRAPEVMGLIDDDQDEYTNAVDIWSLGCVSYWLSTQRVPFSSKELIKFTARSTDFPLNPLLSKSVTNEGIIFLRKAIAIQPSERFTALIALDDPWLKDVEPELQATQLVRDNEATQLLRDSHFDIHTVDFDVNKALLWAASRDYEGDTVQLLLRKGADVAAEDDSGQTALHLAASYGRETTVRLLLEKGTDVAAEDDNGRRALHWAASYGRETTVRLLLEKGANIVAQDGLGQTALHLTALIGDEAIMRLLLEKGADIAAQDKSGETALHLAASYGHETIVRLLLEKGADIAAQDGRGQTALHWAASYGYEAIMQLLTPNS